MIDDVKSYTRGETQVDTNSSLYQAWLAYKATDDFVNTRKWARVNEHTEGSLWAAFDAGFRAAAPASYVLESAIASPLATASAGLEDADEFAQRAARSEKDTQRLEWIVSHLYYGTFELEPERGKMSRLSVMADDSDEDRLAPDWRERIDSVRDARAEKRHSARDEA